MNYQYVETVSETSFKRAVVILCDTVDSVTKQDAGLRYG